MADNGTFLGLKSEGAAEEDMTGKRQERQIIEDVKLSPEQQKIADLVGLGVNTVKDIAYLRRGFTRI